MVAYHIHCSVPCFFPLNIVSYRLFHINMYKFVSFSLTAVQYCILWLYYNLFYQFSVGYFGCFQSFAKTNNAARIILYILFCVSAIYP